MASIILLEKDSPLNLMDLEIFAHVVYEIVNVISFFLVQYPQKADLVFEVRSDRD